MSGRNVIIKLPNHNRSSLWTVFKQQFEVTSEHTGWTAAEKAILLVTTLQGQAVEVLQGAPLTANYSEINTKLERCYGQNDLALIYRCEL